MKKQKKTKREIEQMLTDALVANGHPGISLRVRGSHSGDWAVEILDGGEGAKEEIAEAASQLRALYDLDK